MVTSVCQSRVLCGCSVRRKRIGGFANGRRGLLRPENQRPLKNPRQHVDFFISTR